jgi:hypothetical protein
LLSESLWCSLSSDRPSARAVTARDWKTFLQDIMTTSCTVSDDRCAVSLRRCVSPCLHCQRSIAYRAIVALRYAGPWQPQTLSPNAAYSNHYYPSLLFSCLLLASSFSACYSQSSSAVLSHASDAPSALLVLRHEHPTFTCQAPCPRESHSGWPWPTGYPFGC